MKHLLHANNAVGSFVELILASTGALFGPVALLLFSAGRIPQNLDADAFFFDCLKPPTNTAKSLQGDQGMRENGGTNRGWLSPEIDQ